MEEPGKLDFSISSMNPNEDESPKEDDAMEMVSQSDELTPDEEPSTESRAPQDPDTSYERGSSSIEALAAKAQSFFGGTLLMMLPKIA
jgi:hypothetical protein